MPRVIWRCALPLLAVALSLALSSRSFSAPEAAPQQPAAQAAERAAPRADAATRPPAAWDLINLVANDPAPPDKVQVVSLPNFDELRRSVGVPIPSRVAYPIAIPQNAQLDFGYSIHARIFGVYFLPKANPTRVRVVFTEEDGTPHVLHDRVFNPRDDVEARRWFDEKIDLTPYGGHKGTLAFEVARDDDPNAKGETVLLLSTPRVLQPAARDDISFLFITIDCLRADHLGAHGYQRPTTPALDKLAAEGVRFTHAYSNAPMTIPSLPQIFTSAIFPQPSMPNFVQPIAAAGIPNAAFVNNVWLVLWLARANVPFDKLKSGGDYMAEKLTDDAVAWLQKHRDSRFALYLHYLDAHTPYHGPTQYARMFADPAYHGKVGDSFDDVDGANSGKYDEADKQRIVALYDGQVRFIDDQMKRIFDELRDSERLENTVIVVSADHGEEFWDHGKFFHGQSLYDELLHVPLLVRLPAAARAGTTIDRPVRSIDIAPSLLAWLGLERPAAFAGRDLGEVIAEPELAPDQHVATATAGQFPTRYGVRTPERKLVDTINDGSRQLFDLTKDPGERKNVLAGQPSEAAALQTQLRDARTELLHEGYQVVIVGPATGKQSFRLTLKSMTENGVFETIDRTSANGEAPGGASADSKISLSSDAKSIWIKGETDASGRSFRFDRQRKLAAAMAHKEDPVRVVLSVGDELAPPEAVELGAGGKLDASRQLEILAPELSLSQPPPCPPPASGVRVCLWRVAGAPLELTPVVPPIPDAEARDRLKALGYIQ